jgi:rhodanese-related sulfurtransferase
MTQAAATHTPSRSTSLWTIAALFVATAAACGGAQQENRDMSPDELYRLIQSGNPPLIVDVRTGGEYRTAHVPGAIHRPFHELLGRDPQIPGSTGTPLVVYCAHGPRAGIAAWGLRRSGYTEVLYLKGNMSAWKARELPVERASAEVDGAD